MHLPKLSIQQPSRPVGAWLGFSGLYALMGGACPCCGQPACPTNFVGVGLVGLAMTAALRLFRRFAQRKEPELD